MRSAGITPVVLCVAVLAIAASSRWSSNRDSRREYHNNRRNNDDDGTSNSENNKNDWAIVAGASEGLGAAWAEHLCESGWNVLMIARRDRALRASADRIRTKHGCRTDTLVQDLSDPNLADVVVRSVLEKIDLYDNEEEEKKAQTKDDGEATTKTTTTNGKRRYGLLVYNAAYIAPGPFLETSLGDQHTSIAVNVVAVATLVHVFANHLRREEREGGIVLMSSIGGLTGLREYANYAATKAWNTQFAHGIYDELRESNIDVLACVAGATWTPNYERDGGSLSDPGLQQPIEVATECLRALGGTSPSVATGPVNKLARLIFSRILPHDLALRIMNHQVKQRMTSQ